MQGLDCSCPTCSHIFELRIKFLFRNQHASASLDIFKALYKQLKGCKGIMGGSPKIAHMDEPNSSNFLMVLKNLILYPDMRPGQNSKSARVGVSSKKADLVNQNNNPQFARKMLYGC
ncbi:hypothetical protein CMV_000254 [Castanea mollissima]|uniref:Uncharacterized protein n=1 Tax=Castanea mollissima TaxID=60419 RepID=A0A8J4W589_9ROSI|nr:hypothetical protein CMV_000254 [Castanea mollissima]